MKLNKIRHRRDSAHAAAYCWHTMDGIYKCGSMSGGLEQCCPMALRSLVGHWLVDSSITNELHQSSLTSKQLSGALFWANPSGYWFLVLTTRFRVCIQMKWMWKCVIIYVVLYLLSLFNQNALEHVSVFISSETVKIPCTIWDELSDCTVTRAPLEPFGPLNKNQMVSV